MLGRASLGILALLLGVESIAGAESPPPPAPLSPPVQTPPPYAYPPSYPPYYPPPYSSYPQGPYWVPAPLKVRPYQRGTEVPPGYHIEERHPQWALLTGTIMLGSAYVTGLLVNGDRNCAGGSSCNDRW